MPKEPKVRRRRRVLVTGALLAGLAALVTAVVAIASRSGHVTATIPAEEPLDSYRIVYRVATPNAPVREEERDIARPFEGRYIQRSGAATISGFMTNADGAWTLTTSGASPGWIMAEAGPNRATADQHAAAALAAGRASGLARVMGERRILGRRCAEVRTRSPLGQPLSKPTDADHTDVCVDRTGVLLSEKWTSGGKVVRIRMASRFDLHATFDAATFRPEPAGDATLAASSTVATVHQASSAEVASLGYTFSPPPGYTPTGPVMASVTHGGPNVPTVAEFVQYFRNRDDLIDVVQGVSGRNAAVLRGTPLTVPGIGRAYLSLDMTASTLQVIDEPGGHYVRLEGADVTRLVAAASGLRVVSTK